MPDRIGPRRTFVGGGSETDLRYADMGDGTYAEVVATKSLDAGGGGGASSSLQANVHKYVEAVLNVETVVWQPAAGKRYRYMGGVLSTSAAGIVRLRDGNGGPAIFATYLAGNGSVLVDLGEGILSGAVDRPLTAIHSAGAVVAGVFQGGEE